MTGRDVLAELNDLQFVKVRNPFRLSTVNIIIADDDSIFRTGLARVLAVEDDLRIVGQPRSAAQVLNALEHLHVHILLVSDRLLPELCEEISPPDRCRTAIVALADEDQPAARFVALGLQGVLYRSIDGRTLIIAVRRVARGGMFIHSPKSHTTEIQADMVGTRVVDRLSEIELNIIGAVFQGYKNCEIAQRFGLPLHSIKNALRSVFDKVGVSDRLELALFVYHHSMLQHAIHAVQIGRVTHRGEMNIDVTHCSHRPPNNLPSVEPNSISLAGNCGP